ncbi:unnamed protein product [Clonostachys rosea f. rosea IK726]|uniref:Tachykinin family protein n=2 Tax=Bionectria ochroleuca TaxID=29856 RepID=A0A0B7KRP4_BIOOC|nr:unnamed protein product [Clonostachys rosea f. rosea IK726]
MRTGPRQLLQQVIRHAMASNSPPGSSFAFVGNPNDTGEARSHAMRAHWKRRRQAKDDKKRRADSARQQVRQILPKDAYPAREDGTTSSSSTSGPPSIQLDGIPAQALAGMNRALACGCLDPFDMFPVKLTVQHHKLLHHWLSTYATMMFTQSTASNFNPMRDVWLPLDMSNAASFNAIMAHSAAHLARMQGFSTYEEAFEFKAEAVHIVSQWMSDAALSRSDDLIAAVLRLLTFERYWGSEDEWQIHHDGLLRLIEARGGMQSLKENWRLGLPVYLVCLMAKPTWFDSSNQIWDISAPPEASALNPGIASMGGLHRLRSLWLLSFVQDIGTFVANTRGLATLASTQEALLVIKNSREHLNDQSSEVEFTRLACLVGVCVILQSMPHEQALTPLEVFLNERRESWAGSVNGLYSNLCEILEPEKTQYVLNVTYVLSAMSQEAKRGVELCLLRILRQGGMGYDSMADNITPDVLLSSLNGQ